MKPKDVKIIQFTDTHLFAQADKCLAGVNTRDSYLAVKKQAISQHRDTDLILHTGDLCQEPDVTTYQWFADDITSLNRPVYCLPGNHDDPKLMQHTLGVGSVHCCDYVDVGAWRLIFLSTAVYGSAHGYLSQESLLRMRVLLEVATTLSVLICLHHNPLPMGSQWLDTMTVGNGEDLMATLVEYKQVKAVLHGHVHQASDREFKGIRILSTPSTCFQFEPSSDEFSLDALTPGYRWLLLRNDGEIESGVDRLAELPAGFEQDTTGY